MRSLSLFNAILLAPEARIERVPVNDLSFHLEASQRLGESIAHGEPFLDPWVSQWALGYPLSRSYQPLPHLLAAAVMALARPFASPAASFAAFYYLLLVLLPASIYLGARLMGLNPLATGFAALLILAPTESADFGGYGLQLRRLPMARYGSLRGAVFPPSFAARIRARGAWRLTREKGVRAPRWRSR